MVEKYRKGVPENSEGENVNDTDDLPGEHSYDANLEKILSQSSPMDAGYSGMAVEKLIEIATSIDGTKPIRIVEYWRWLDFKLTPNQLEVIKNAGLQPSCLMADRIIYDSTQPDSIGHWVRTSLLLEFIPPGLFITKNRIYVMWNSGTRLSLPPDFVLSIF